MNDQADRQIRLATQERAVDAIRGALDELARAIEKRLLDLGGDADLLTQLATPTPVDVVLAALRSRPASDVRLGVLAIQITEVEAWLDVLGFDDVRSTYLDRIEEIEDAVERHLTTLGLPGVSSALDAEGVRIAVQSLAASHIDKAIDPARADVARRVHDAMLANAPMLTDREFAVEIADAAEGATPQALTRARAAFAEMDRFLGEEAISEVEAETGEEFLRGYVGPEDSRTRHFCDALLGKAFTIDEIEQLNNGHGMPAATGGGGHNCRHGWVALHADQLEDLGFVRGTAADIAKANAGAAARRSKRRRRR